MGQWKLNDYIHTMLHENKHNIHIQLYIRKSTQINVWFINK